MSAGRLFRRQDVPPFLWPVRRRRILVCRFCAELPLRGRRGRLPATGREERPVAERVGLLTYEVIGDQCEVVTLDAFTQFAGVGTALMNRVIDEARTQGCRRLWLITTNDNLDAVRFYQKRGFTIAAVHVNAIAHSRTLKPSIPLIGNYGIPIRDEVELEMLP